MAKVEFTTGQIIEVLEGAGFGEVVNPRELVSYKVDSYNTSSVYMRPVNDKFPHHKPIRFSRRTLKSEPDFLQSASTIIVDPKAYLARLDDKVRLNSLRNDISTSLMSIQDEELLEKLLELVQKHGGSKK